MISKFFQFKSVDKGQRIGFMEVKIYKEKIQWWIQGGGRGDI